MYRVRATSGPRAGQYGLTVDERELGPVLVRWDGGGESLELGMFLTPFGALTADDLELLPAGAAVPSAAAPEVFLVVVGEYADRRVILACADEGEAIHQASGYNAERTSGADPRAEVEPVPFVPAGVR